MSLEQTISSLNMLLTNSPYFMVSIDDDTRPFVRDMIANGTDCHDDECITNTNQDCFGAAIATKDGDVAAYISFTVEESLLTGDPFVLINFSCTSAEYRRTGLSLFLRLVPLEFAVDNGIPFVASDTNLRSGALLTKYFGFVQSDEYLLMFNHVATSFVEVAELNMPLIREQIAKKLS